MGAPPILGAPNIINLLRKWSTYMMVALLAGCSGKQPYWLIWLPAPVLAATAPRKHRLLTNCEAEPGCVWRTRELNAEDRFFWPFGRCDSVWPTDFHIPVQNHRPRLEPKNRVPLRARTGVTWYLPAYWWSAPTTMFEGTDLRPIFESRCKATGHLDDEATPLLPASLPPRSSLDRVTSFGYKIMTSPNEPDTSSSSSSVSSGSNSGKSLLTSAPRRFRIIERSPS
jgi:hypothetical protein